MRIRNSGTWSLAQTGRPRRILALIEVQYGRTDCRMPAEVRAEKKSRERTEGISLSFGVHLLHGSNAAYSAVNSCLQDLTRARNALDNLTLNQNGWICAILSSGVGLGGPPHHQFV